MTKDDAGEAISNAFYNWLDYEVASSSMDKNIYLDEYDEAIAGLKGGLDHPTNYTWPKLQSHLNRLPIWFEGFRLTNPEDDEFDYQAARLTFAGLMQISGSYRNQCYVQSKDQDDYLNRRTAAIGFNIYRFVDQRIRYRLPYYSDDLAETNIGIEDLNEQMKAVSKAGEFAVKRLCKRVEMGYDLQAEDSISALYMEAAQRMWLKFATDSVLLAAKIRDGDLAGVPFLEPKSISADPPPKVFYPMNV